MGEELSIVVCSWHPDKTRAAARSMKRKQVEWEKFMNNLFIGSCREISRQPENRKQRATDIVSGGMLFYPTTRLLPGDREWCRRCYPDR